MKDKTRIFTDDDSKLVSLCKKGDIRAFEMLVEKHQKRVFNIAYRMLGHFDEASDITQEAFIAVYKGIEKFQEKAKFSTWLCAIAINRSKNRLSELKRRKAREKVSLDDPINTSNGQIRVEAPSNDPTILEQLEAREVRERVQGCIDALDEEFREVVVLRDIQELTYEEIGEILKIPQGTVKSRLFRGRESVKDCLKKALGDL